jgi:hypothetical protein
MSAVLGGKMKYTYYVDGIEYASPLAASIATGLDREGLCRAYQSCRATYRGVSVERRPVADPTEPLAFATKPHALDAWLLRQDRMHYGGIMRVEVAR